jgi:hypothetical protein
MIKLTEKQAHLVLNICISGLDQFRKHLMHDDWDADMDAYLRKHTLSCEKDFLRAIDVMLKAISKEEK